MTRRVYCPERLLGGAEEDLDGGWSHPYFDPETMGPAISDVMARSTAMLYGWQTMAAAWPDRAGDPYADSMNGIQKYVASRTLTQADLVDEYVLLLEPVLLGGGKRLFPAGGVTRPLELVSATVSATGVGICTYRPQR